MGIDFHPGSASWSYSGFNRFRERLAEKIDIDLSTMEGFGGHISWDLIEQDDTPEITFISLEHICSLA